MYELGYILRIYWNDRGVPIGLDTEASAVDIDQATASEEITTTIVVQGVLGAFPSSTSWIFNWHYTSLSMFSNSNHKRTLV
jgi:hypothetical protein